jgi:hypothetical protein
MPIDSTPFADLPAALVEEVLGQTSEVGDRLLETFTRIREERKTLRNNLDEYDLVMSEHSLGAPSVPTTCATDGSYAIERLLTIDLVAAAAVIVEGLTPPSETRHWEEPRHTTYVETETHHAETSTILRAVMLGNELRLAQQAPHELVMIDGSFTLPIIYFNQALNIAPQSSLNCAREFLENCEAYLESYSTLLRSERSDRQFIAMPKYATRREIGQRVGWPEEHDDRGLLTLILKSGELTKPLPLERHGKWHLNIERLPSELKQAVAPIADEIVASLNQINVFYYKPHDWLPALRVETAASVASNTHRLGTVIQGLRSQCATAAMLEPYPIYLADRTVKSLARAVPAFRQVATQRVSEKYDGDIGEVFFAMHGYRSESGA